MIQQNYFQICIQQNFRFLSKIVISVYNLIYLFLTKKKTFIYRLNNIYLFLLIWYGERLVIFSFAK